MTKIFTTICLVFGFASFAMAQSGGSCASPSAVAAGSYTGTFASSGAVTANTLKASGPTQSSFYTWTAPDCGTITVTSGVDPDEPDTQLGIWTGTCAAPMGVQCDDDGGPGFTSTISGYAVNAGDTYFIEWSDGWSTDDFDWSLTFTAGACPVDFCMDAPSLTCAGSETFATLLTEDFDGALPGAWTGDIVPAGFTGGWTLGQTGFAGNAGPPGECGLIAYYETSGNALGTVLNIPSTIPPNATNAELCFNLFNGDPLVSAIDLEVSTDGGATWTSAWSSATAGSAGQWQMLCVNLSAFAGSTMNLRFIGTLDAFFTDDIALDNIRVETCLGPITPIVGSGPSGNLPDIADPCDCFDPQNIVDAFGVTFFHELITVTSLPGETWILSNTAGMFDATGAPLPVGTPLAPLGLGGALETYFVDFWVADAQAYNATATNGVQDASITSICFASDCCSLVCPADQEFTMQGGQCEVIANFVVASEGQCEDTGVNDAVTLTGLAGMGAQNSTTCPNCVTQAYPITDPCGATVNYTWSYTTTDSPFWDPFEVQLNGAAIDGTDPNGANAQTGAGSIPVVAGDVVVFDQQTADGLFGVGITDVTVSIVSNCPGTNPILVSGPGSGVAYPIGTTENVFVIANSATTFDTCRINITVNPIENPTESLSCNDDVNVSMNDDCEIIVTADMFLEGGPYNCYETGYAVYFSDNPGVDVNNQIVSLALGNYTVTVEDVATGNFCWGNFVVEDKVAPVIPCADFTVTCIEAACGISDIIVPGTDFSEGINGGAGTAITDFNTSTVEIPVAMNCNVITDLNVCLDITHTFIGDLLINIVSPAGTSVSLWGGFCGVAPGLNFCADDEGTNTTLCADFMTGGNNLTAPGLAPNPALSTFDGEDPTGTWTITIQDQFGGDTGEVNNIGLIFNNGDPACDFAELNTASYLASQGACGAVSAITSSELSVQQDCGTTGLSEIILRTWLVTDAGGNTATCLQQINVTAASLADFAGAAPSDPIGPGQIRWPMTTVEKMSCGDDASPEGIYEKCKAYTADPISTACDQALGALNAENAAIMASFPHIMKEITFRDAGGDACGTAIQLVPIHTELCNMVFTYTDNSLPACGGDCPGNEKVVREWTVLDWCAAETANHTQVIKVADSEAPTFVGSPVSEMTVSASPWGCAASFILPTADLHDNCDYDLSYIVESLTPGIIIDNGVVLNAPKTMPGETIDFVYTASDCCGNEGVFILSVTVVDATPPIPITKENVVISLTVSPNTNGEDYGIAKMFTHSVDNGSHDGDCGPVRTAIRRASGDPACDNYGVNDHNNNTTYFNFGPNVNPQPADHNRNDTDDGAYVKFCCEDLTELDPATGLGYGIHEVWLGVWDDANMDGVPGTPGDNFNQSWTNVRVESKLDPIILCPPMAFLSCDDDPTNPVFIETTLGTATAGGLCATVNIEYTDSYGADLNGNGSITDILVEVSPGVFVNEIYNTACRFGPITRTWSITGSNATCEQIVVVTPPTNFFEGCTDLSTTQADGSIIWPYEGSRDNVFDANGTAEAFENDQATCLTNGGFAGYAEVAKNCASDFDTDLEWVAEHCALIGYSMDSTIFYFEADACLKIVYEYTVIDWCQYDPDALIPTGIWTWTVIAKVIDDTAPEINCPEQCFDVNESCVTSVGLTASATDSLSDCGSEWIQWTVLVDLWGDGINEYEFSSFVPEDPANGLWDDDNGNGIPDIRIGNLAGQPTNLPPGQAKTGQGEELTVNIPEIIEGSKNNHIAVWKAYDGCGNVTSKTVNFQVIDKKPPTPYCVNLSTALMGDGTVTLWACDFDRGSFDNCTPQSWLRFTFSGTDPADDPAYDDATRCSSRVFTCDDFTASNNGETKVNMFVWDECGNSDFCQVNLRMVDNQEVCEGVPSRASIAGNIATEDGRTVLDARVELMTITPEYPADLMTDGAGNYSFPDNPMYLDYDINSVKNDDYLNGVSTLDLVLIQKHILGLQALNSGYKMIAADVNNDEQISTIDLIELRKLILGIYTELPQNGSWRFADANTVIDVNNPWPFTESLTISNLIQDQMDENFVGIKVGDVNGSVILNLTSGDVVDNRSAQQLEFDVVDQTFSKGDVISIDFNSSNFDAISGFQFTLNTAGLELIDVNSNSIDLSAANFAKFENQITASWNSETAMSFSEGTIFNLSFKANAAGSLSQVLDINSDITRAESYATDALELNGVSLRGLDTDQEFVLMQNQPNPFKTQTVIGFKLPLNADATLSIYDVTGKVVNKINGNYAKGYNEIILEKNDLPSQSGVYYYKLESGSFTASKKMITIE